LLEAEAVVHNEGSSGAAAAELIDKLGVRTALGSRLHVVPNSAAMMAEVTGGGAVIGLAQGTNAMDHIAKGTAIVVAGHFPREVAHVTTYEAAISVACRERVAARVFMKALDTSAGRKALAEAGLE
jgi:molybdate transport system substrate-binding protein